MDGIHEGDSIKKFDTSKVKLHPKGEVLVDNSPEKRAKSFDKNMVLSLALADGEVSNEDLAALAKIDFTVDDVRNILNNPQKGFANLNLSDDDKQKLTDELMTKIETYRQLNQERKGQEPKFGL